MASKVKPYAIHIVETYLDGFRWRWDGTFSGGTIDTAVRRAGRYNAQGSRAVIVAAHGRLTSMTITARPAY